MASVDSSTFCNYRGLARIGVPSDIRSVNSDTFSCYASLGGIAVNDNIAAVKEGTFGLYRDLTRVAIPTGIASVSTSTFCNYSARLIFGIMRGSTTRACTLAGKCGICLACIGTPTTPACSDGASAAIALITRSNCRCDGSNRA